MLELAVLVCQGYAGKEVDFRLAVYIFVFIVCVCFTFEMVHHTY